MKNNIERTQSGPENQKSGVNPASKALALRNAKANQATSGTAEQKNKKNHKVKAKTLSSLLLVALAAATVFLQAVPADYEAEEINKEFAEPKAAVEYVVNMDDLKTPLEPIIEEKIEKRRRSKLWSLISIPLSLLGTLAGVLLKPIIGKLLVFVLIAAFFFGILCLCLKIINPDIPLKEQLTPRNIAIWLCSCAVFALALEAPSIINPKADFPTFYKYIAAAICTVTMVLLCDTKQKEISDTVM